MTSSIIIPASRQMVFTAVSAEKKENIESVNRDDFSETVTTRRLYNIKHQSREERKSENEILSHPAHRTSLREAQEALNRIGEAFGSEKRPQNNGDTPVRPEEISLAASLLGIRALGDNASLKATSLEIRTRGAENLRLRQNADLRQQIDNALAAQQKAHKGGIFSCVIDWIVSAVEVVVGAVKVVGGILSGTATSVASGLADITAGTAGLAKAICETLLLCGVDNKDIRETIEVAGKIQFAFEMLSMAIDVTCAARGIMAARTAAQTTEKVVAEAAEQGLKNVSKETLTNTAQEIGKKVADEVAEQIGKNLAEQAGGSFRQLIPVFSHESVEKIVAKAVEAACSKALKEGSEISAKKVADIVRLEIIKAVIKATIRSTGNVIKLVTHNALNGAETINSGMVAKDKAELQKAIQELMNENTFMQFLLDEFENVKKRRNDDIRHLMDGASQAMTSGAEMQTRTGAMLCSIAAHIV